ncbi:FkbM family methyltransferase [Allokutzneria sp. A3M-2-11 16]|uniref:FkbM family methyltransferase n=1 Tax=Allokutzneria sp. A3M-2-11 16 TaxID=2962043 RepID=UPI0020B7071C|nr:FkbM family methyltransferase [Allokutzneria sp. A3M-2-11 16]MCP3801182.1 FkbM family methyltransferase [Allokutzneria sp. A3M-2-11 16]
MTEAPAMSEQTTEPQPQPKAVLNACTVATRADLPAVRLLSGAFLAKHPGGRFLALLVDAEPEAVGPGLLTPADIGVDAAELSWLATACTPEELRAVLQPRLMMRLLAEVGPVLYLDSNVLVLDSVVDEVLKAISRSPVVLLPRVLEPLPRDGMRPAPEELLTAGMFDPGFIAVAPGSAPFLNMWAEQVRQAPDAAGAFLDGAPALVEHEVLRDPGIGVSIWNIDQRPPWRDAKGRLLVGDKPLRTVHLSGFDPQRPWLLSANIADRPRVLLSEHPPMAQLCAIYRNELVRVGHNREREPYAFAALPDGTPIPDALRREYRRVTEQRNGVPPAKPAVGPASDVADFLRWACEPADENQHASGGSRWGSALWQDDPELRRQYPDPFGAQAKEFRTWCATTGVATGRVHPDAVPRLDPSASLALVDQLGVSVVGTGAEADLLRATVRASGLPTADEPVYPVVLRCAGAHPVPGDRYVISVSPDGVLTAAPSEVDEVWVLSDATRQAMQNTAVPVRVLALPVPDRGEVDRPARKAARARFGLDDGIVFVSAVDHTVERRGNALGLVSAFLSAFPDRQDARLVLAVSGAARNPEAAERLRLATASDHRILLVERSSDGRVTDIELTDDLLAMADCVVSLHRAEGNGADRTSLLLARAASMSLPILASHHGAVAEMFTPEVAMLVPCHGVGTEPDVQAAVELMRSVAEDPEATIRLGQAAREHLTHARTLDGTAKQLRDRVEHAYRGWRAQHAAPPPGPAEDPLRPLLVARHALLRKPNVETESRTPGAPALRKAVLRVLSHYDNHLREVLTAVVDGVERTAGELARRQNEDTGASGGRVDADLRADVIQLAERQTQLDDQLIGVDDGVVRARADMASQGRRLQAIEDSLAERDAARDKQIDTLAERIDKLTSALNRTLDRIDSLESSVVATLRDRDARLETGVRAANDALRTADSLRRIVVREHDRAGDSDPSLEGTATSVVLTDAGLLRLPSEDSLMLPVLSTNGVWEPELSALIDSLVEPDGVFVDIGAHVGYHSIRVLNMLGTSGAVVAVEPDAQASALLRHNVGVNVAPAVAERLSVVDAAAWDSSTELAMRPALTGGVSVHPAGEPAEGEQPAPTVRAVRLEAELDALPAANGMRLSVVKVDAPGGSHRALGGLVRLLRRDRPHVVCSLSLRQTVALGDDPAAVLREFGTWGYDLVPIGATDPKDPADLLVPDPETGRTPDTLSLWLRPRGR